jgi:threonine dehydratase
MTVTLEHIQQASERLYGVAIRTPLLRSAHLNTRLGGKVFIKPECLQHIGAFKFRGAYNRLSQIEESCKKAGVVAFSSGNHAQGIAYAAQLLGMPATIVMPTDAPEIKKEGTKNLCATIQYYNRFTESREDIAADIAAKTGAILVPAFEDVDIIAGQGTCALEILQQLDEEKLSIDHLLSPVGGGGLLAGSSTAVKSMSSSTKVYGVEQENFEDHYLSKQAGKRIAVDGTKATLCDALMATTPGELTWSINSRNVDDYLVVSDDAVAHAISYAFRYLKIVVEPGGAVALAALLQGKLDITGSSAAIIVSGGNIDRQTFESCLNKHPSP